MSGLKMNSNDLARKALEATKTPPSGGDFVWDGVNEDERPLSISEMRKTMGRPKLDVVKDRISIRLNHETTEFFRATGKGWQTRIDEVLTEYVKANS